MPGRARRPLAARRRLVHNPVMEMADARLLNGVILSLYREGREVPLGRYRAWALEQVATVIGFDCACWGSASADPPALHEMHLHNCDRGIVEAYARCSEHDFFRAALIADPGTAISLGDLVARETYLRSTFYRRFGRRFRIEWALGTLLRERTTALHEFLTLWRQDPWPPFSETDRQLKELLMPHLAATHRAAWLRHFLRLPGHVNQAWAVVDRRGLLREASPSFVALLRQHWPACSGSILPEPLAVSVQAGDAHVVGAWRLDVSDCGEYRFVLARSTGALAQLSVREREIARRYASGETHSAIARALSLSPATVRNHVAHCFRKLGVGSKVELALRLDSATSRLPTGMAE
ncbi:LuxR family transcriptional regulator [Accumulibacter sp.]|uniref:helix-turn-helix transcriptional regulator n=1 Tax=Accumulibacter sp. TaxID=2053492 RepID=UPI0025FABA94|nr:LuxR family transcriptional regulator [Accumulibacter sp.]MCM8613461.1 LuxR C-terminal-related transcriptional regulator [Accumulibacter sp.]MCM8637106.1 LuxR C-terminal-related transcriptional regulator [Accumulibacter sp.]MCM8640849.1 LuxR C-terminal-related transcriptional regulator [Accumulibacter sp.]